MKKILLLSLLITSVYANDCLPSALELCDYSWGTFYHLDNNVGISLLGNYNQSNFSNNANGATNTATIGGGAEVNFDVLMVNGLWWSNRINYQNYFGNSNYTDSMFNYTLKLGYAMQAINDYWLITPYATGSMGAGWETWDGNYNYGAGLGIRTEVALVTRNSLYFDYSYQWLIDQGELTSSYNNQFNTSHITVGNQPVAQIAEIGYKHVFNCGFNMNVFYRYTQNNFSFSGSSTNQNYTNGTNMIGIGVSWYTGG
ncbi:MAG: hypothetical protein ORN24_04245 [Burkholderiales bacterium]|nr:hypothetical protein [Burkholderiales bacterium]